MINKQISVLLASASIGLCGVWYSLTDSEIKVNSIIDGNVSKDEDLLRKRNSSAFQVGSNGQNTVGSVWKTNAKGNIYRDDTYFVFRDYSWLNGIKIGGISGKTFIGGENLKSYVNGVGLKVEKINDKWEYKSSGWERTRKIDVKRVLMKDGYQFQTGKGTCFLKATDADAKSHSNLYLLIGFMKTNPKDNMSKPDYAEFVSGQESFCKNYANNIYGIGNDKIAISFDVTNGNITGKEYPIIARVNSKTIDPIYWKTREGISVNAVVLAFAIKGQQESNVNQNGWKILNEEQAKREIRDKIRKGDIVERHSSKNTVGFELKKENNLKGESTEGWITKAEVTYK